jgi:hypothetical protein
MSRQPCMKRRTKIITGAVAACLLAIGVGVLLWRPVLRAYFDHRVRMATTGLPSCDRVEVFRLDGETDAHEATGFPVRPYGRFSGILDRRIFNGEDAEKLAALWRSQTFGWGYQAMCHEPAYGFRFHRGSTVRLETSVCFHCSNFYFPAVGESDWWGFRTRTPNATNLLSHLQEIFPNSVAKPEQ